MKYLILSHFDVIEGPRILLKAPELAEDKTLEQIPQLLNLFEEGFFVQIFSEFKSTNLIFNIPSDYARGRQEILLISILLNIEKDIDLNLAQNLLIDFKRRLRTLPEAFKAFYIGSHKYIGDEQKLEEIRQLFLTFYEYAQTTIKALEEAEVRYRALFKAARDAIFIIDKKSGIIVDANKQAKKLLQRPIEEIIGMDVLELQIEKDYERVRSEILEAVRSEEGSLIGTVIENYKGNKIPVEITASEIVIGGRRLIQCIFRDITERKEAEEKLRESEEKFKTISEESLVGIIILQDDEVKYINQQAAEWVEYDVDEMLNWNLEELFEIIHPEDRERVAVLTNTAQQGMGDDMFHYSFRVITKNG
ncbi:MAG: PAS domain-containing protein, partial [Candidatus Hodarchaeota archaeon]